MARDWTRKELDEALDQVQDFARSATQWEAIRFCRQLLAAQFPKANEIIIGEADDAQNES